MVDEVFLQALGMLPAWAYMTLVASVLMRLQDGFELLGWVASPLEARAVVACGAALLSMLLALLFGRLHLPEDGERALAPRFQVMIRKSVGLGVGYAVYELVKASAIEVWQGKSAESNIFIVLFACVSLVLVALLHEMFYCCLRKDCATTAGRGGRESPCVLVIFFIEYSLESVVAWAWFDVILLCKQLVRGPGGDELFVDTMWLCILVILSPALSISVVWLQRSTSQRLRYTRELLIGQLGLMIGWALISTYRSLDERLMWSGSGAQDLEGGLNTAVAWAKALVCSYISIPFAMRIEWWSVAASERHAEMQKDGSLEEGYARHRTGFHSLAVSNAASEWPI